ncbi:AAA family ATPase [Litorimonas sp. WD9-15]|uniref:AAA family ATPase n=1 Tax=Litorimonas sp. WD9-15 TaxID=3418716 RepID=UPI003D001F90
MITNFKTIKNLGVFNNYSHPPELPQFKRFNLIYGTNGSGKTTISRFFNDLNSGEAAGFPELKYRIESDEGSFSEGQPYSRQIRVFNSEYVDKNIGEIEGQLHPIFIIGEDNTLLAAQLAEDEANYQELEAKISAQTLAKTQLLKERGQEFTNIARTIGEDWVGTSTRKYNKTNAEKSFTNMEESKLLSSEELVQSKAALKQNVLDKVEKPKFPNVSVSAHPKPISVLDAISNILDATKSVVKESATSIAIEGLKSNPQLSNWVEQGRDIHTSTDVCQYCLQPIPLSREEALQQHFNDSDSALKTKVTDFIADAEICIKAIESLEISHRDKLYEESREEYAKALDVLNSHQDELCVFLYAIIGILEDKLTRRTESYAVGILPQDTKPCRDNMAKIIKLIDYTNSETEAFTRRIKEKQDLIEHHHLSSIKDRVAELDTKIASATELLSSYQNGVEGDEENMGIIALKARIDSARTTLSDSHRGAEDLSKKLETFLGRPDLKFVPEDEGYRIERFGRPAQKLSEGEKTAITFLYFVVGLKDSEFTLSEGIVVIDDPISSLDAASIYQAFGFLKIAVQEAKQVFLLTHNFNFLKLLLNWLQRGHGKRSSYYMLACTQSPTSRETKICELDKTLREASNEYQYLFKTLKDFQSDGTIANSYHIPNIVRKVLETFLDHHSTGSNLYKKLVKLDYDEQKKTALYKYANDLSHPTFSGLDPALVGETQTNVGIVLRMIEEVAPLHFKTLEDNIIQH